MTIEAGLGLAEMAVSAAFQRVDLVPGQPERPATIAAAMPSTHFDLKVP